MGVSGLGFGFGVFSVGAVLGVVPRHSCFEHFEGNVKSLVVVAECGCPAPEVYPDWFDGDWLAADELLKESPGVESVFLCAFGGINAVDADVVGFQAVWVKDGEGVAVVDSDDTELP